MYEGRLEEVWRWPVKSMAGEPLAAARLDERGLGGDRSHVLIHEHKGQRKPLTAREAPRLLAWQAAYPSAPDEALHPASPPPATITNPGGRSFAWDDPDLAHALSDDLGRPVGLQRDLDGVQDLPRSVLVTTEATLRELEAELGEPVDLRRFRTNLHLVLDAPAWAEQAWEGRTVALAGGVELTLLHPCERCVIPTRHPDTQERWPRLLRHLAAAHQTGFGINARVTAPGVVRRGERVEIS